MDGFMAHDIEPYIRDTQLFCLILVGIVVRSDERRLFQVEWNLPL